jgi:hypothetical protein
MAAPTTETVDKYFALEAERTKHQRLASDAAREQKLLVAEWQPWVEKNNKDGVATRCGALFKLLTGRAAIQWKSVVIALGGQAAVDDAEAHAEPTVSLKIEALESRRAA